MIPGLPEIRLYPLLVSIAVELFIFYILATFFYRLNREKLALKKRLDHLIEKQTSLQIPLGKAAHPKKTGSFSLFRKVPFSERLGDRLALAGILLKPDEFLTIWALLALVPPILVYLFTFQIWIPLLLLLLGAVGPLFYINLKRNKRMTLFTNQLGDSLTIMSNCLRSGLSLQQAMVSIANEMPEPISKEFSRVLREVKFGSTIETALNGLTERMKSKDLELMVSAILIQRQVGGNLSEILDNISTTIAGRIKIQNDIKVMTATGRVSGLIIGILPVGVGLMLMFLNPSYFRLFLETQLGIALLIACVCMEAIGFFLISRIVKIKY